MASRRNDRTSPFVTPIGSTRGIGQVVLARLRRGTETPARQTPRFQACSRVELRHRACNGRPQDKSSMGDGGGRQMKIAMRYALIVGVSAFLALPAARAQDQQCQAGCGQAKAACIKTARVVKLACRTDCRTNAAPADLGGCIRGCVDTFRGSVTGSCRDDLQGCLGSCTPPTPDADATTGSDAAACLGTCGGALGECARGVTAGIRSCVAGCGTGADRLPCLQDCATTAQSDAENCATTFQGCAGDCGAPTPPPPPSPTTTLPPVPSCQSSDAPTCGGSCPAANQQCMPVDGGRCACVGGAPQ